MMNDKPDKRNPQMKAAWAWDVLKVAKDNVAETRKALDKARKAWKEAGREAWEARKEWERTNKIWEESDNE